MAYRKSKKGAAIRRWLKEEWKDEKGNRKFQKRPLEHGGLYLNLKKLKL
jgi:hypothetical protein